MAMARTSTESPRARLVVDADTSIRKVVGNGAMGGVDSLQAVNNADARMIVRTFVIRTLRLI
jgi:hypothetical protein